jgi:23S rRNA pseudouridine955/2504/2580 synthase
MEYLGMPLVGEGKYGQNTRDRERGYKHQALCSYSVTFNFEKKDSVLDYLTGKTVHISPDKIYFVTELFGSVRL